MISVVMANYNGETFLRQAIESVLSQDHNDFEFVIVDDGSTDSSCEVISEFESKYPQAIRAIYLDENCGQGVALNRGIAASRGDVICLMDSDDVWFAGKLQAVDRSFSGSRRIVMHQHNLQIMRHTELTNEVIRDVLMSGDYYQFVKEKGTIGQFVPTSGLSFPRWILEEVLPIPSAFTTCADGYLTRTSFCHGTIASDFECWGAYRIHSGNNVAENGEFQMAAYLREVLYPSLRDYYQRRGIGFGLALPDDSPPMLKTVFNKLLDASPRQLGLWVAKSTGLSK
jgi:glycosyltransferase involved in cell wall biosynthesis